MMMVPPSKACFVHWKRGTLAVRMIISGDPLVPSKPGQLGQHAKKEQGATHVAPCFFFVITFLPVSLRRQKGHIR